MEEIKKIQNRLLEMAKVIDNIFTKNNIPYMIAYGTLLGAVRHQGFIPWDDDFDIYLFEDEKNSYEDVIQILAKELPKDMFLEYFDTEPKFFHGWARIRDLNTEVICNTYPQDNAYLHRGLTLDLFKTVKIKEKDLQKYRDEENKKYLERRKKQNLITEEEYNKRLQNKKKVQNEEKTSENDTDIYAVISATQKMFINEIFPLKRYKFENFEFLGPNNSEAILRRRYGDYMKLPPEDQRITHYSSIKFLN